MQNEKVRDGQILAGVTDQFHGQL